MARRVLLPGEMDRKRRQTERRKAVRTIPSPEAIQAELDSMTGAVHDLQNDVEALIKRPNVLPWRPKSTDADKK